ncbi:MAG: tyrosine-type recombinase/integrase [Veillonella sp.]|uniref:tyrosine-type recombinase/integrase n=1 Tax=Veillonella sp. TaxID=1926307 RepID=UPI00290A63D1|nr:tyrosine-type recombinase/integrase [Veillonella sp.]MDU6787299.1 tyrosine-type recombinase/integrase [Veillonella sp.]
MQQHQNGLTLKELAKFIGVTTQTVRNKLKNQGLLLSANHIGNKIVLTFDNCKKFIATSYPCLYNEFAKCHSTVQASDKEALTMYPIPKGKGRITQIKQRSGNTYFYVRDLPLFYKENGEVFMYKSEGFTSKDLAEAKRLLIISERDAGKFKFDYLQQYSQMPSSKIDRKKAKKLQQSYYDFCVDYYNQRCLEEGTKRLYLTIIERRIKVFFGNMTISELTKGHLQAFVDNYSTNIPKMFTVLNATLSKLYSLDLIPEDFSKRLIKPDVKTVKHLALTWDDIEILDDAKGYVHIRQAIGLTEYGYGLKSTKTSSSIRKVPFNSKTLVNLLRAAQSKNKTGWVVENKSRTGRIYPDNFRSRYFKAVGEKLNFPHPLTSHVARHTYISHLVAKGVPLATIAKWTGHSTINMIVNVYTHAITNTEFELKLAESLY